MSLLTQFDNLKDLIFSCFHFHYLLQNVHLGLLLPKVTMGNDNSIIVKSFCYNKITFFGAMFDILVLMQILDTRQYIFICDNPAMPHSRINSSILS